MTRNGDVVGVLLRKTSQRDILAIAAGHCFPGKSEYVVEFKKAVVLKEGVMTGWQWKMGLEQRIAIYPHEIHFNRANADMPFGFWPTVPQKIVN